MPNKPLLTHPIAYLSLLFLLLLATLLGIVAVDKVDLLDCELQLLLCLCNLVANLRNHSIGILSMDIAVSVFLVCSAIESSTV